jgi:hypothetical protein
MKHPALLAITGTVLLLATHFLPSLRAEEAAPVTARDLAARLSANMLDGASVVRLKMEIQRPAGGAKTVLQLQVKTRRTKAATEIIYSVLWPKDRKGESFLLRRPADRAASGSTFSPPDALRPIPSMKDAVFGSDLSYDDLVDNFFAWEHQAIVGTETVDRIPCQILESKPDKGDRSTYARVRSWIDVKRMVPLRVEKYGASGLVRRIDTTRVVKDDKNVHIPASLAVQRPGQDSVTEIEGTNIRHDVNFSDGDFTPDALRSKAK